MYALMSKHTNSKAHQFDKFTTRAEARAEMRKLVNSKKSVAKFVKVNSAGMAIVKFSTFSIRYWVEAVQS